MTEAATRTIACTYFYIAVCKTSLGQTNLIAHTTANTDTHTRRERWLDWEGEKKRQEKWGEREYN